MLMKKRAVKMNQKLSKPSMSNREKEVTDKKNSSLQ
jgi:hypothetical protein